MILDPVGAISILAITCQQFTAILDALEQKP